MGGGDETLIEEEEEEKEEIRAQVSTLVSARTRQHINSSLCKSRTTATFSIFFSSSLALSCASISYSFCSSPFFKPPRPPPFPPQPPLILRPPVLLNLEDVLLFFFSSLLLRSLVLLLPLLESPLQLIPTEAK